MAAEKPIVALDIGGTKMLAVVYDSNYTALGQAKNRPPSGKGPASFFTAVVTTIDDALKSAGLKPSKIAGIGVGAPGPLDPFEGIIIETPNLGLRDFHLREKLTAHYSHPVAVDNDVTLGTYGEVRFGAAQGMRHVVGVFPGTGVGGGLVLNGELYRGAQGFAGEIGHMIVDHGGPVCGCGQHGCLEALASRIALAKEAAALALRGDAPTILKHAGTDIAQIRSKALAYAFEAGDPELVAAIHRAADVLGVGMANLVNILNPEMIVMGGGLVEALGDAFRARAESSMRRHSMSACHGVVTVVAATLGDHATALGAAALIRDELTPIPHYPV